MLNQRNEALVDFLMNSKSNKLRHESGMQKQRKTISQYQKCMYSIERDWVAFGFYIEPEGGARSKSYELDVEN